MSILKRYRVFRGTLLAILIALVLQYVLGMCINLAVTFPGSNTSALASTQSALTQIHISLGTLLLILPLLTLGLGIALKQLWRVLMSLLGFLLIFLAFAGDAFYLSNFQTLSNPSFWMALGMMGALVVFGIEYYLTRPALYQKNQPKNAA